MATYYPEGECFFRRSSLVYPSGWSAANEHQFYSHVLIEYYWNGWVTRNNQPRVQDQTHFRSRLVVGRPQGFNTTDFGLWDRFFVGESVERDVTNMLEISSHPNSNNFNECRDRDGGGPLKYILRPIRIRNPNTQWLWIDGTIPLRAIYFPVCHRSDEAFQDYCTYAVIDFRARRSVDVTNLVGQFSTYPSTPEHGLGLVRNITWGFNVPNIITYLSLPRQVRNPEQGLYRTAKAGDELFVRASSERTWHCPRLTDHARDFHRHMDIATVISATFGIEVGWRPYAHSSFIGDLLIRVTEFALGFVPGVGPLLSVGFGIAVQAITNPGSFAVDNVLDLGEAILEIIIDSAGKGRKYMAPDVMAPMAPAKALTEDERKARKEAGEALNAHLTKVIREMQGKIPPQSQAWLDRIADGAKTARTAKDAAQTQEDAEQAGEEAEKTAGEEAKKTAGEEAKKTAGEEVEKTAGEEAEKTAGE